MRFSVKLKSCFEEHAVGMSGDTPLNDPAGFEFLDEEDKPAFAEDSVDREEVTGEQRVPMGFEKLGPRTPGLQSAVTTIAMENPLNGSAAEIDGDLGEFALDLRKTEPGIEFLYHQYQLLDRLGDGSPSWFLVRELPAEFDEVAIPT